MSDVDPLIRRELNWMALSVLENKDLMPLIEQRVRRRRIRRWSIAGGIVVAIALIASLTIAVVSHQNTISVAQSTGNTHATGSTDSAAIQPSQITGLQSDYPLTWEQSIGYLSAISKSAGIGDTLGGLTATGLRVSWKRCESGQCPETWMLSLKNNTQDLVQVSPALTVFTDHSPLVSDTRPTSVVAGGTALLVFTFPEFAGGLGVSSDATWQWNWYLTPSH